MRPTDRRVRRVRRAAILVLTVAAGAILALATTASDASAAWRLSSSWVDHNGHYNEAWVDEEGNTTYWEQLSANEWEVHVTRVDEDNPNPEDSTGDGRSDWQGGLDLAKQAGNGAITIDPQDFPFGRGQTGRGEGLDPVHNPDPSDIFRAYEEQAGGGGLGGGFSGDGDGFSAWLRSQIKSGGGGSGGDDDGEDEDPPKGMFPSGEELPGPPELVNPPDVGR